MPTPYAPGKPSQPSKSQPPDTSGGTSVSVLLAGSSSSPPLNGATGGLPPVRGETRNQIAKVSPASSVIDVNTSLTPIPYVPHKLSQPSTSQPPDTSEAPPASVLLSEHNSPPPNSAADDPPPSQDVNEDSGETEKQAPKVSMASSINGARSLPLSIQDGPNNTDDNVQRVRIEPERTGWARMYDLVREYDKNRITDNKEDIDTLLVFVSLVLASLRFGNLIRTGWFVLSGRHRIHYRIIQEPTAAA